MCIYTGPLLSPIYIQFIAKSKPYNKVQLYLYRNKEGE